LDTEQFRPSDLGEIARLGGLRVLGDEHRLGGGDHRVG